MSGQTLQKVQRIIDTSCVVSDRLEEESRTKPLAYGSVKVQELAEILGGKAREPYWIGKGWNGDLGSGEDALDPKGVARALETGARKNTRVRAWGFIISIPKGVSLLAAFDPEIKEWLDGVMTEMQDEYMRVLEQGSVVRFGDGGCKPSVPVSGLKGWGVKHAASAGGDPHYHVHLIVSATANTIDGRKGQIHGKKLLNETAKIADGSSRRILMREMERIGLGFGLDGEVVGIDKDVIERASTARNAVEAIRTYFATYNTPISDEQAWHHWRQIAEGKVDKALPQTLIEQIRTSRGEKLGGEAIEHAMDEAISDPQRASALADWLASKYKLSSWQETSQKARDAWASYPRFDDVTRVIALIATLPTAPKPEAVAGLCARFADDEHRSDLMERVGADPRLLVGARRWVLKAQLDMEELITKRSENLLTVSSRGKDNTNNVDKGIDELLSNTNDLPLVVIQGVAGGGKSSALAAASELWKANGVTVWATARNRLTATDTGLVSGADISHSLSTFALRKRITLSHPNTPKPGDVLVVDEFGLLDHGDIEMILSLAEQGVQVKALGDSYQIQPIDGSTSARLVMDLARKHAMANLDETKRCESWKALHDALRSVVVGEAEPRDVLEQLDIRSASSADEAVGIVKDHPGAEIAVRSNELRCLVAQALPRPEMQMFRGTDIPNITMLRDGIAAWVGDQVVVRRNGVATAEGLREVSITNGEKAKIVRINHRGVGLEIDGKQVTVSRETAKESLALGGVHTGDSAQGQTWERAVVVLTGIETREWLYSALTRGRNAPIIVVLSDEDEPAQTVVEKVLAREGISQSVEEMCKTDATLAESVRRAREGDFAGDPGGQFINDDPTIHHNQTTDEPSGSHADHLEHQWENSGSEQIISTADNDLTDGLVPADNADGGYIVPGDEEPKWEYEGYEREPVTPTPNDTLPVTPDNNLLEVDSEDDANEKIRSGAMDLEAAKEALRSYRADKFPSEHPSISDETKPRQYLGGFFYKNDDGVWVVDFDLRHELWRKATRMNPHSTRIPTLFYITGEREIKPGSGEFYDPSADTEMVKRFAKEKAEDDADWEARHSRGSGSGDSGSGEGKSSGRPSGGYGKSY